MMVGLVCCCGAPRPGLGVVEADAARPRDPLVDEGQHALLSVHGPGQNT